MSDSVIHLRSRWTPELTEAAVQFLQGKPVDQIFPTVLVDGVSYVDLRGLTIHQAQLDNARIERVNLRWSTFDDVGFKDAKLVLCNLSHVSFKDCYFRRTQFLRSDLVNAKFEDSDFSNALIAESRLDFATFKGCEIQLESIRFREDTNPQVLVRVCRNLKLNAMSMGHFADAGELTYKEKTYDRMHLFNLAFRREHESLGSRLRAGGAWLGSYLMNALWGYGEKPVRLIWVLLLDILLFGTLQYLVRALPGQSWGVHLYFSGITFLTIGYGDLAPVGFMGRFLAITEGALGVATTGLLIASATKRIMYR